MTQVNLFGPRCLVEHYQPKSTSTIVIPDAAQKRDTHRMGIVRYLGDGKVKGKTEPVPSLVNVGDIVMFQVNQMMIATQALCVDGMQCMNLLQSELIARISGDHELGVESMEMLGDYVLLKHFLRERPGSSLFLPDSVTEQRSPDFIYFRCFKLGTTTQDVPIKIGDELVVNYGRLTPMLVVRKVNDATENQEFVYTRKEWIDGVIIPDEVEAAPQIAPQG